MEHFNFDSQHSLEVSVKETLVMEHVRGAVREYHLKSPAHFELGLEVHQVAEAPQSSQSATDVLFEGNRVEGRVALRVKCGFAFCKRIAGPGQPTCSVVVFDREPEALDDFLDAEYPIFDAPVQQDTLWRWWLNNGNKFEWTQLPVELKERIIGFCLHQPQANGIYSDRLALFTQRNDKGPRFLKPGPFEIIAQLGDWYQLLYISHQVRAITLRLCITGGSILEKSQGLCIDAPCCNAFVACINRLGEYYQMVEEDSVPTTNKEEALSRCYHRFPSIYPELEQYATFRHGIRKVSLGMDFLTAMHFFKVEAGDFHLHRHARWLTYDVFELLPNLNEIVIRLPLRPSGGWRNRPCPEGVRLFHDYSPCPRILHRMIYERAAKVLASHKYVTLLNFIDGDEKQRFLSARMEAVNTLSFTKTDLEELYAVDGGGVELQADDDRLAECPEVKKATSEVERPDGTKSDFFPPICRCRPRCALSGVLGRRWMKESH